ncbi:RNA polymerase sigma-70 factor [Pseudonocardia oroxyli]|uniref:RNA polymerase, sigma-24 subunit, RpoE n=1 Tax=Pseudonocardia oroxyli TaxID=366584 RepID=A0A1G7PSM4_PSEOR|nr:RNA polymerase sigma-70 factor [Pseudonocardia oroxyli]SDF89342.1 RNA polymerase, sigma-24 subunit, RpoE [Pseudonocardia oroxyli]
MTHAERFTALRPLLFTIAYEILGSAAEADDVLQESYLRWADVDLEVVRDDKSYLARVVTRQALNALRTSARRREEYVGPWLPEPVQTVGVDGADTDVVLAESVSMAMLVVLETLGPDERAVFVLREVFGFDHAEIAEAVGRPVATVRQIAHRAREHVHARRKRYEPVEAARVTERFLAAAAGGDVESLMALLAPDVVWTADGGGKLSAARRPVVGAQRVLALLGGMLRMSETVAGLRFESVLSNGAPAVVVHSAARLEGVFLFEVADGLITHVYAVRNPDKLADFGSPRRVSR